MCERVYMHTTTKGGESYSFDLGIFDDFSEVGYMSSATNVPWYPLFQVDEFEYVAVDALAKVWFVRMEVH